VGRLQTISAHPVAGPVAAGIPMGYVDLAYASRPIEAIRADLDEWGLQSVGGIFFDQAPTSPFSIGPVAMAVRAARRLGFDTILLNPGRGTDSLYRGLGATVCTCEGDWTAYQHGTTEGVRPGDGHVVYGVPSDQLERCLDVMRARGAAWGVATPSDCLVPSLVTA
jgi:spherulation-specific family 4 protein